MSFQREDFRTFYRDGLPLLEKHKDEISHFRDIPLEIDCDRYLALEEADALRIYTIRGEGRQILGYSVFIVGFNPHYQWSLQANEDVLYVDPQFRKGRLGIELIKQSEAALKEEGVEVVYHHVKLAHPALGVLLERQGYQAIETIYTKRLERA